jgi:hypothetical protein
MDAMRTESSGIREESQTLIIAHWTSCARWTSPRVRASWSLIAHVLGWLHFFVASAFLDEG